MPIDPSMLTTGAEWQVPKLDAATEAGAGQQSSGASFGDVLGQSLDALQQSQDAASTAATQLATGQASDPTSVVMAVEKAQLEMQLASQVRTKAVDAVNDIFHTTV